MKNIKLYLITLVVLLLSFPSKEAFALIPPDRYNVAVCANYDQEDGSAEYGATCSTPSQDGPCLRTTPCMIDRKD